jgi:hypothetical protein
LWEIGLNNHLGLHPLKSSEHPRSLPKGSILLLIHSHISDLLFTEYPLCTRHWSYVPEDIHRRFSAEVSSALVWKNPSRTCGCGEVEKFYKGKGNTKGSMVGAGGVWWQRKHAFFPSHTFKIYNNLWEGEEPGDSHPTCASHGHKCWARDIIPALLEFMIYEVTWYLTYFISSATKKEGKRKRQLW